MGMDREAWHAIVHLSPSQSHFSTLPSSLQEVIPARMMGELKSETGKEREPGKETLMNELLQWAVRALSLCRILRIVSQRGKEDGIFIDQFLNLFG